MDVAPRLNALFARGGGKLLDVVGEADNDARTEVAHQFNLTGGATKKDYPEIDFEKLRAEMPPVLECQFAIRTGKRWIAK